MGADFSNGTVTLPGSNSYGEGAKFAPGQVFASEHVKSDIADVKNIGKPMQAGTISAAAFLKEFVGEDIPWVHFDIAGTAWGDRKRSYFYKQGATGEIIRTALNVIGA
jgi:leucyl aminopeptidase